MRRGRGRYCDADEEADPVVCAAPRGEATVVDAVGGMAGGTGGGKCKVARLERRPYSPQRAWENLLEQKR
jgi:hypothetical protein